MVSLFSLDEYEAEMIATYEYADKISLTDFSAEIKLKENKRNIVRLNSKSVNDSLPSIKNKFLKLPKLTIQKFYGS